VGAKPLALDAPAIDESALLALKIDDDKDFAFTDDRRVMAGDAAVPQHDIGIRVPANEG
jgi:hypothetical protein